MREIVLRGRGPNTMSLAMLEDLERRLDEAGDDALLVTGAGDAFSAGLDLDELASADATHLARLLRAMERLAWKLALHPAPTIALVNGHAIAGGCLVVQCCDLRVGVDDERVRIGMTGVAIGIEYPPFVTQIFRLRVPPPHIETVLLGAERVGPRRARELGLLDEVVARDEARALAEARLAERARLPRRAYAAAKRALRSRGP